MLEMFDNAQQWLGLILAQAEPSAVADSLASQASNLPNPEVSASVAQVTTQSSADLANTSASTSNIDGHRHMLDFVRQSDIVGKVLFSVLVLMSIVTWYLIALKSIVNLRQNHLSTAFLNRFWSATSLQAVDKDLHQNRARDPFSRLADQTLHATDHYLRYAASNLAEVGTHAEFVTRSMRKVIDAETARLENGLTILGSIGSTAPFVGLFGTVWGVYHALLGIGLSDGVSINKIAGPVGEALIMTGLGLAVAIPAVLAFNAFVRRNRIVLNRLDGFAHDLLAFVVTGQQVDQTTQRMHVVNRCPQHENTPCQKETI